MQNILLKEKKESIISKQIIRSATSIGANINEANYASSKPDFISKLHISLKECAETEYWIQLLEKTEYIDKKYANELLKECLSIKKMLISSLNTAKTYSKKLHKLICIGIRVLMFFNFKIVFKKGLTKKETKKQLTHYVKMI